MKTTIIVLTLLCVASFAQQKGTLTDTRDKKTYKTVKIGEQVWMAENLNYDAKGSKCYDNKPTNCTKYGRLYDWETAKTACPDGWHLPSIDEWQILVDFAGGEKVAEKYLKAKSGWNWSKFLNISSNGVDTYGFAALPGGGRPLIPHDFIGVGDAGWWWSATEGNGNAYYLSLGDILSMFFLDNLSLLSVRCVQD